MCANDLSWKEQILSFFLGIFCFLLYQGQFIFAVYYVDGHNLKVYILF